MKTIKAYKQPKLKEPLEWEVLHNSVIIFAGIDADEPVSTPQGTMIPVQITTKPNIIDMTVDLGVMLAKGLRRLMSGAKDPESPEIWYWNEKFWCKAVVPGAGLYYKNQRYLLYEVQVRDPELLLGSVHMAEEEKE